MRRYIYGGALAFVLSAGCGNTSHGGPGAGGKAGNGGTATAGSGGATATAGSGGGAGLGASAASGGSDSDAGMGGVGVGAEGGMDKAGGDEAVAGANLGPDPNEPQAKATKLDLLLAIDNSVSMRDKQTLLAEALPHLIGKLINPACVDGAGNLVVQPSNPQENCPAGSMREIAPLRDVHVGAITSSLGSHGGSAANFDICSDPAGDDHGHLIPTLRPNIASYQNLGYLKWDPDSLATPPGQYDVAAFIENIQAMVSAAGERGCGFEAQLESVYRFLIDPAPPLEVVVESGQSVAVRKGVDTMLLEQRERFLRPDSSVVVLMLSDENDCSIQDEGYGWLLARGDQQMFAASSDCASDPNSPCCRSCAATATTPAGCMPLASDPACTSNAGHLPSDQDSANLRCFEQKRRFGFELLHPLSRYLDGFTGHQVPDRSGVLVDNPLFQRGATHRSPTLFTFALLGGVPWQDIATPAALQGGTVQYMSAEELVESGRWPVIVGDPTQGVPPTDPFMRESLDPRTGTNPVIGAPIVPASSTDPQANPINGHEQANVQNSDLQFACTFRLPEPIICDYASFEAQQGCDCFQGDLDAGYNRSVCNPPGGGAATITQSFGKAYPSLRQLAVTRDLGARSVLGSVCAPHVDDPEKPDYGYGPLVRALSQRLQATLTKP